MEASLFMLLPTGDEVLGLELTETDGHFSLIGNREFERTNYRWVHQTMFKKTSDNSYWYFDYFHRDNKIHYEVFNEDGDHLGEASAAGVLQPGTADRNKSIADILHGK